MISKNMRGGSCTTGSSRSAKANNPCMKELYDPDDETSFRLATDATNLYGKAMTEPLPYGSFEWCNPSHIPMDFVKGYDNAGGGCYISEVDLEYPIQSRDKHNDYPLAPELTYVKANSLSPYQVDFYKTTHQSLPTITNKQIHDYIKSHPSNPRDEKSPKSIAND